MTATAVRVRERPIIMSADSVRAILAGSKTQTRRVVEPQPTPWLGYMLVNGKARPVGPDYPDDESEAVACPYGQSGDRLWVREVWAARVGVRLSDLDGKWFHEIPRSLRTEKAAGYVFYRADRSVYHVRLTRDLPPVVSCWEHDEEDFEGVRWQSSRFMPRWASRLTLEITDIRVQRVQEISDEDVRAEGIAHDDSVPIESGSYRDTFFRHAWDGLNAKRGYAWEINPWCWAITFRRVQ